MTPFSRLQKVLEDKKRPRVEDVKLLVAYHEQALRLAPVHQAFHQSDQYLLGKYMLEQLNNKLHGTAYDYSAYVHPPSEEAPRVERLIKKYRKTVEKKKWKYTFFWWYRQKYPQHVYDSVPESKTFMDWYKQRRENAKRKTTAKNKDSKSRGKSARVHSRGRRKSKSSKLSARKTR
jgi:hypothetical protein